MGELLFLLLVVIAAWWLAVFAFGHKKSAEEQPQRPTYKRQPYIPAKRGMSELTRSAIERQNQPPSVDIPLIEVKDLTADEYLDIAKNRPFGEVLGLLVPATLVDGKQTWELAKEAKQDLQKMLECCRAQLEEMRAVGHYPAPYYFKRAAILFRKQKMYEKEAKIIEFYWRAIDEVLDKNKRLNRLQGIALKQAFEHRYEKAKILFEKQKKVDSP